MKKWLRICLLPLLAAAFLYSAGKLINYYIQEKRQTDYTQKLSDRVITTVPTIATVPEETVPGEAEEECAPFRVDFDALQAENSDVVGWLYCADTPVNYPIVQGRDNNQYLHRLPNGQYNPAGTLFADFRATPAFAGGNTVVYGHNMKNKTMFGTLEQYRDPAYYAQHPVMYLFTPEETYKLVLVAGCLTGHLSEFYDVPADMNAVLTGAIRESTFSSEAECTAEDRFVTLSTCAYDFPNARFVLLAKMVPIKNP